MTITNTFKKIKKNIHDHFKGHHPSLVLKDFSTVLKVQWFLRLNVAAIDLP